MLILDLKKFRAPTPPEIVTWLKRNPDRKGGTWSIVNKLRPADLYVYLYAKFGEPNGIQNLLRDDDSDNLIHWEWTLEHTRGLLLFQGMNLRTEVHLLGRWDFERFDRDQLIRYIKTDFSNYGPEMSRIRREILEDWETFLNPYQQLRTSIDAMRERLLDLGLDPENDAFEDPSVPTDLPIMGAKIEELSEKYAEAYRLSASLRVVAPILAESFVNLLLFALLKPDIRENERLSKDAVRGPIDIKVQSLHLKCDGFKEKVDWSCPECRAYNTVVNERNDILHGNIVVSKLKTGEVYFNGRVPVFKQYVGFWGRTFPRSLQASGYHSLESTLQAVDNFIKYVLGRLEPRTRAYFELLMGRQELGRNLKSGKLGVLLPEHVVDMQVGLVDYR